MAFPFLQLSSLSSGSLSPSFAGVGDVVALVVDAEFVVVVVVGVVDCAVLTADETNGCKK